MRKRCIFIIFLATILSLSACGEESNRTKTLSLTEESYEYTAPEAEFVLGPNLSTAIAELALMYDEFDSAQTQEDYYPQSFIFHFCQNSRLTFDYLEQLREEKNGILSVEDVEYIQQSLTDQMIDMENHVPTEGIDINQTASGLGFGNIISYETDVLGEEVHLVAEFERGTDEFHPTKLYELDIVLIQNPESCFDGYSIKSLTLKEITPS